MNESLYYLILFSVGFVASIVNTLAGGGSLLTLPVLIFLGLPSNVANGTNRILILINSIVGTAGYKSKGVSMFFPKNYNKNTQKLDDCLIDAAQFYWGLSKAWLNKIKIFNSNSFPINFESLKAQDIDDKDDWIKAELMFKYNNKI